MEIFVYRSPGDRQGPDIIDPLLSTEEVGRSRGRAELDALSTIKEIVTLQVVYRADLKTGQLVLIQDALQGASWKGKITNITHKVSNVKEPSVFTTLIIERPSDFYNSLDFYAGVSV